jgi:hypothetical protein
MRAFCTHPGPISSSILRGAWTKERWNDRLRHVAYAAGWKKFEPAWDMIIKVKRASSMLPVLETVLTSFGSHASQVTQQVTMLKEYAGIDARIEMPEGWKDPLPDS